MLESKVCKLASVIIAMAAAGWAWPAKACDGAGVIIQIGGRPQDVQISRIESGATSIVTRPRVLEVICRDDVVRTSGDTYVVLSVDGAGTVRVDHNIAYTVPARSGAPSLIGNGYRALDEQIMPDMKRLPWNVRLKGAGDDFGFALPGLAAGGQQLEAGTRSLLLRLVGGAAPYKVEITDSKGTIVASQASPSHEVVLNAVPLAVGTYHILASDSTPGTLTADIAVVDTPPRETADYSNLADPEVRVAAAAATLARDYTATWSLEAEQQLQAAPVDGLDRDKVFELIESYGSD
ncbi:MAG TPA: hypothetical protein VHW60_01935 [Caulobacteraceae bacterium]|jgi:hypothetical protein|nr:hypothetical protein [Caulobacteraceae bacterium]